MFEIRGKHDGTKVIANVIILDASSDLSPKEVFLQQDVRKAGFETPTFRALIDTGAERSMVSADVVSTMKLQQCGQLLMRGIAPVASIHNAYKFHIVFLMNDTAGDETLVFNEKRPTLFCAMERPVTGGEAGSTDGTFDVIIGMDILSLGMLTVDQSGIYSFAV